MRITIMNKKAPTWSKKVGALKTYKLTKDYRTSIAAKKHWEDKWRYRKSIIF